MTTPRLGYVVIGRNEGERLRHCLQSLPCGSRSIVYVDSGSMDGSPGLARSLGIDVVELDTSRPYTAARGRNAGFDRLLEMCSNIEYVQFVDGDCALIDGWVEAGIAAMDGSPELGAVAGRLRECDASASIYSRLCDMEWARPPGETEAVGGISIMRARSFLEAGGFDPHLIAGEEPDLCLRMSQRGWKFALLADDMAWHASDISHFWQWWIRTYRGGHAWAENAWNHWGEPGNYSAPKILSILFWGGGLIAGAFALGPFTKGASLLALCAYPLQLIRMTRAMRKRGLSSADAGLYASFTLLGKTAEASGVVRCAAGRILGRKRALVEYK